jgi:hypothetical protein
MTHHDDLGLSGPPEPVQPSNGPTSNALVITNPTVSDESANPLRSPVIMRFDEALKRTLPDGYKFDDEQRIIYDVSAGETFPTAICGPIRVASQPRRVDKTGWSFAVEFADLEGVLHQAWLKRTDVVCGKAPFFTELIDQGFKVYSGPMAIASLLNAWPADPSWRVDSAGWFTPPSGTPHFISADGSVYPKQDTDRQIIYSNPKIGQQVSGNLNDWQKGVAHPALGNPVMIFAIAAALAGPLLRIAHLDTVGFNFYGTSGIGKSLLLRLAASCGGDPDAVVPWSATRTGLHRLSPHSQDGLLALDGFPSDPDTTLTKALRAFGEDTGAGRVVCARDPDGAHRWRRVLLSTSEAPLANIFKHRSHYGKTNLPAAFGARIIDIPAGMGAEAIFEDLHGFADASCFARHLNGKLAQFHGTLTPRFLDALLDKLPSISDELTNTVPSRAHEIRQTLDDRIGFPPAALPQIAERFALIEFAGELAIRMDLLPWPKGTCTQAVEKLVRRVAQGNMRRSFGASKAHGFMNEYVSKHACQIVEIPQGRPAAMDPNTVGFKDDQHIYLMGDHLRSDLQDRDEMLDLDELMALIEEDDTLKPGGEARSRQFKMPATKVETRPRVYRLDREKLGRDREISPE